MFRKLQTRRSVPLMVALALVAGACSSDGETATTTIQAGTASADTTEASSTDTGEPSTTPGEVSVEACDDIAAQFVTRGSANPDLADPFVSATCDGESITIESNGIPDYTYVQTSPGDPAAQDYSFTIPAAPVMAAETTAVPALGTAAISLGGVPIYGPTEGTGGDVLSLEGALSECGSHNGPTGFHIHLLGSSATTDCLFTQTELADAPQLLGYAFDGYPIYTGNSQYASSWELTDASLFASDTWAAHTYAEGLGDLDECNGTTDADGNYAYYTTDSFPYVLGCYRGEVTLAAGGGGGAGGGPPGDGEAAPEGEAPAGEGGLDLTDAATTLGVSVEDLQAALGEPPPDLDGAAATLGISVEDLEAALPPPPGG